MELDMLLDQLESGLFYIFLQPVNDSEIVVLSFIDYERFSDRLESSIIETNDKKHYESLKAGYLNEYGIFEEIHEIN